jgi:hypothetical protein
MLELRYEFITGVSLGFEYVDKEDIDEFEQGWVVLLDLLIFRLILEKTYL